ncbi:MAG TPA: hypothetical protein PLQ98_05375 [Bacillota bacterium]|jgi:hypothetical protein|nr:hypothetical protein [Bacillota bacterium]
MKKQRKLGRWFLPSLTLVLLLLTIAFYLPVLVTDQLTKAIAVNLYSFDSLSVKHKASPAFLLFFGKIRDLTIEGSNLEGQYINLSRVFLQVDKLKVSMWDLLVYGRLNILDSEGRAVLSISQAELDKYLHRFYIDDQYHSIRLDLLDDGIRISGTLDGREFYLDCVFTVEQNSVLALSPKRMVSTNGSNQNLMNRLGQMASYSIDLGVFGFPLIIDDASSRDGYLYVFASVSK